MAKGEKPRRCGECLRFVHNSSKPGKGWCDEWAGVELTQDCVCHPNVGILKDRCDAKKEG